jgi:hypothetical protein
VALWASLRIRDSLSNTVPATSINDEASPVAGLAGFFMLVVRRFMATALRTLLSSRGENRHWQGGRCRVRRLSKLKPKEPHWNAPDRAAQPDQLTPDRALMSAPGSASLSHF